MTTTMAPVWLEISGASVVDALQRTREKLNGDGTDVFLDFSSVARIDPAGLSEMEKLAGLADAKSVKVALRRVNVDIYRVLKLMRLAPRFSFVA